MRPIDILFELDESASVSDDEWMESIDFISQYAFALNGGPTGTRLGLGPDQVRLSVVHWAGPVQQTMGIPFRYTDDLEMFIQRLFHLQRMYHDIGCPGVALKVRKHRARSPAYSALARLHNARSVSLSPSLSIPPACLRSGLL